MRGFSAKLAHAAELAHAVSATVSGTGAVGGAGSAVGAADEVVVVDDDQPLYPWGQGSASKALKVINDRLAAVRDKLAADEHEKKATAALREAKVTALRETKAKELEDEKAASAAARAAAKLRFKTLSDQRKLDNVKRRQQERQDVRDARNAANILQNMGHGSAGGKQAMDEDT